MKENAKNILSAQLQNILGGLHLHVSAPFHEWYFLREMLNIQFFLKI
jgi:hypothetical protein